MAERGRARLVLAAMLATSTALAQSPTPGYPERVLQWTVKNSETCEQISTALYGSAKHRNLLERYNAIRCAEGNPLRDGSTLVVPERPTELPTARLRSLAPQVRARSPGGAWAPAEPGMPLYERHSVNTLAKARADILFVDRTRVLLAEHTLVVIYDTAKSTAVARTTPSVELESGEVQAGLAALGGRPFELGAQGGRVTGTSRDTVLRAKADRATVSVFDGSARVSSAARAVDVPKNHGTSFRRAAPPTPPRPLPPAPRLTASSSEGVLLAEPGRALLAAGWESVPNSARYRIELARDAEFAELVLREEMPASVRAFRAEKLPPGAYFLRVRAIDTDDFLGVASETRAVVLVEAKIEGRGSFQDGEIEINRYGMLRFAGLEGLELSIDGSRFAETAAIDPLRLAPHAIALRMRGLSATRRYAVRYVPSSAVIASEQRAKTLHVTVRFDGFDGIDITQRVRPSLWVTTDSGRRRFALGRSFAVEVPLALAPRSLRVVDGRGILLGRADVSSQSSDENAAIGAEQRARALGVTAPIVPASPLTNVAWWSPTRANAISMGAVGYVEDARLGAQAQARGSGSLGAFGLDVLVATPEVHGPAADGSAWFKLGWRALRSDHGSFELGPAAELGVPLTTTSPPSRAGLGLAIGGAAERFSWLANLGGRARLFDDPERLAAPGAQAYLLGGATYDALQWLRVYTLLDAHALDHPAQDALAARGGLALGGEVGQNVFGAAALRASPWDDAGGTLSLQLAFGIRASREP